MRQARGTHVSLAASQADFAAALLDPSPDAAPAGSSDVAARRFRVYRNNVRVALMEALAAAYPVIARVVGTPFFERMARVFIAQRPARERTLNFYGDGLADFVADFPPARELPYLADLARLERAVLEARHAADAPALEPSVLTALGAEIAAARLTPHPAARLVRSAYPIADIWRAHEGDAPTTGDLAFATGAAGALVLRPRLAVSVAPLAPGRCAFVETVLAGGDLTAAHAAATSSDAGFDVMTAFRDLLAAGAFAGVAGNRGEGDRV